MTYCESDRGEWGKPCPDCGVTLPARQGSMTTWQSRRHTDPIRAANALMSNAVALRVKNQPSVRRRVA